ncbi:hypothetical protein KRMM14A1004_56020 [Krasilnikovia sp. MM14-A1004]
MVVRSSRVASLAGTTEIAGSPSVIAAPSDRAATAHLVPRILAHLAAAAVQAGGRGTES